MATLETLYPIQPPRTSYTGMLCQDDLKLTHLEGPEEPEEPENTSSTDEEKVVGRAYGGDDSKTNLAVPA
jgi:hypothetical protein